MIIFKNAILVLFQRSTKQTNSSISNPNNPLFLTFPVEYFGHNVTLSLISARTDEPHDALGLVLTDVPNNKKNKINASSGVEFVISQCKYNLDFIEIQFLSEECSFSDLKRAYHVNTARLLVKIENNDKTMEVCHKSGLIRNNCDMSEDISIDSVGVVFDSSKKYVISFKRPIPFFKQELEIFVPILGEKIIPLTTDHFPISKLIFTTSKIIHLTSDLQNVTVICPIFLPKAPNGIVQSIESRKMKNEDNFNTQKEICIVISNIKFKDEEKLKSREVGGNEDVRNIRKGYEKNYEIKLLENRTTAELKDDLIEILEDDVKEYHKKIIVFVLSHGFNGGFYTFDGKMTVDQLVTMFSPKEMPLLKEMKKKFLFSFCQGDQPCDKYSNVYIGYSTLPGCLSERRSTGTSFVEAFIETRIDNPSWEIEQVFELTQRILKENCGQIAYCQNGLIEASDGNIRPTGGFVRQVSETVVHELDPFELNRE